MKAQPMIVKSKEVPALQVLGTEVRFLCEAQSTNKVWSLMEVTLPLNSSPPPHSHSWDEAYFVTAGDVDFAVGVKRFTATAGDFVYTPGGVVHGFSPAHAGAFFKRVNSEVKDLPRDLPKVLEIGEDTGIHFVEPA